MHLHSIKSSLLKPFQWWTSLESDWWIFWRTAKGNSFKKCFKPILKKLHWKKREERSFQNGPIRIFHWFDFGSSSASSIILPLDLHFAISGAAVKSRKSKIREATRYLCCGRCRLELGYFTGIRNQNYLLKEFSVKAKRKVIKQQTYRWWKRAWRLFNSSYHLKPDTFPR